MTHASNSFCRRYSLAFISVPKLPSRQLRLDEDILSRVDKWRSEQDDLPTRAEAMRRLVEAGLIRSAPAAVRLGDGDKLIVSMLCDLFKQLKIKGDTNSALLQDIIYGGHYWALKWEFQGLFHNHEDNPQNLDFVLDVLDMWDFIEEGYKKLSKEDKAQIEHDAAPFGKYVQFPGFDGNKESELIGIARFLIEKLDRFSTFKGRELNSHFPTLAAYRRMVGIFEPIRATLIGRSLTAAEITAILQAKRAREIAGNAETVAGAAE